MANGTAAALRRRRDDLRDLRLMRSADAKDVREIIVQDGAKRTSLGRPAEDKPWVIRTAGEMLPKDFELDQNRVTRRLQAINQARGTSLLNGTFSKDVSFGKQRVQLRTKDGQLSTLQFGATRAQAPVATGTADKNIYTVSVGLKSALLGTAGSFAKQAGGEDSMLRLGA
ncbi:MAG: hypothetical protein EOO40_06500, partial [Deltaproteobacteria bacterium]